MDPQGHTDIDTFYRILYKTLPGPGHIPFDTLPWLPWCISFYSCTVSRTWYRAFTCCYAIADERAALQAAARADFTWERPAACPEDLDLYRLLSGDARSAAQQLSCQQAIASDGCFSLGMLAKVRGSAGAVRGMVLSPAFLGMWHDWPGALPGGRGRRPAGNRHRLLFRRSGARVAGPDDTAVSEPVSLYGGPSRRGHTDHDPASLPLTSFRLTSHARSRVSSSNPGRLVSRAARRVVPGCSACSHTRCALERIVQNHGGSQPG